MNQTGAVVMGVARGSKIFVTIVFIILGLTFWATTGVLYYEFSEDGWFTQLTLYSHLFLFFPTFGILALFAFYVPSVVFTDLYWKHVKPAGKFRFLFGFFFLVVMSVWISWLILGGKIPAYWQLTPTALKSDLGQPQNCGTKNRPCARAPVMTAINEVRDESQKRLGMAKFTRICAPDALLEPPETVGFSRYCFASGQMMNAEQCCEAQKMFSDALEGLNAPTANHSLTGLVHAILLPFKVFFLLVLFVVGALLAAWRHTVKKHYPKLVPKIERGVIVGAVAVLLFPAANHGFLQTTSVLYGPYGGSIYPTIAPIISIAFGAWTACLMFFFFSRFHKDMESMMRIIGVLVSAVAVFQYDKIIDYAVRFIGAGSDQMLVYLYILVTVIGIGVLHRFGADEVAPDEP